MKMLFQLVCLCALVAATPLTIAADRGSFERERSTHFMLLHDLEFAQRTGRQGSSRFEREVLHSLEDAYRDLDALLGIAPRRRLDVILHDALRFDRAFAGRFRFPSAGFFGDRIHVRAARVLDPYLEGVLAHELVHAALDQNAPSLQLPAWVNEGIATWFEARHLGKRRLAANERAALIRAGRADQWLNIGQLSAASFATFDAPTAALAYLQSYALVDHVVERRGDGALREWIQRLSRTGDPARALERAAGLSPRELDQSLRRKLGL